MRVFHCLIKRARSFEQGEIVTFLPVVRHDLLEFAGPDPCDMILHVSSDVERWVCDRRNSDFDMTLLYIRDCILYRLCHLQPLHHHR